VAQCTKKMALDRAIEEFLLVQGRPIVDRGNSRPELLQLREVVTSLTTKNLSRTDIGKALCLAARHNGYHLVRTRFKSLTTKAKESFITDASEIVLREIDGKLNSLEIVGVENEQEVEVIGFENEQEVEVMHYEDYEYIEEEDDEE
jgi:hypothetical protein